MKIFKKHRRIVSSIILIILTLSLFSYDYSYFLYSHKVQQHESLWSILTYDVFNNRNIADHSIKFLEKANPEFDFDYIQANTSLFSNDGDTVKIRNGKISIITAGDELRLEPTLLLPFSAIRNHNIQIIYQNLLLLSVMGMGFYSIIERKKYRDKKLLKNIPHMLFFSFIIASFVRWFISFGFALGFRYFYESTLQSSVLVFKNRLLMIWIFTFLIIFFIYNGKRLKKKYFSTIGLIFGILLFLYVTVTIYLLNTPRL